MSKNIIYCYSGSGNCLDIAKNIAAVLHDTDIVMMRSFPAVTETKGAERVGFIFPCYAGGLPGRVEEYVKSIHIAPDVYKFGIVSCAAYPGVGLKKIHDIVGGLDWWTTISHQCSCIWLFPHKLMMPLMSPAQAQKRSEKLAKQAAQSILAKEKSEKDAPSAPAVNKFESSLWPMLSKKKGAKMQASDACVSCGQCAKLCPAGNITMKDGKPVFGDSCLQCLSCLQYCPKGAISLGGASVKRERYRNPNVKAKDLMEKIVHVD